MTARRFPTAALMLTLTACASSPQPPAPLFRAEHALVIAHRGGALEAPENSLAAVRNARAVGAPWVEVDLHLSSDGVPVVLHDPMLERTTSGTGPVSALPVSALSALAVGRPKISPDVAARVVADNALVPDFGDRFADERLPTLADLLTVPDVRFMLELKSPRDPASGARLVETVLDVVRAHGAVARVAIASFDATLLAHAKTLAPNIPRIGLTDTREAFQKMLDVEVSVLATWHPLVREAIALRAANGPAVWVWTIYGEGRAKDLDALGVDGIITDAPSAVKRALSGPAPLTRPGS